MISRRTLLALLMVAGAAGCFLSLMFFLPRNSAHNLARDDGSTAAKGKIGSTTGNSVSADRPFSYTHPRHSDDNAAVVDSPSDPLPIQPEPAAALDPYPSDVPVPDLAWDATEAALQSAAQDKSLPAEIRGDAQWRLKLKFPRWRGRADQVLGGFNFETAAYSMLDGWKVEWAPIYVPSSTTPPIGVQRDAAVCVGTAVLSLRIYVAISPRWAHLWLAERIGSGTSATLPAWGDDAGVNIGDVWLTKGWKLQYGHVTSASFWLARRNVVVEAGFRGAGKGAGQTLDAMKFAEQLDRQIRLQGHAAKTWADLKDVCPAINEFAVDDPVRRCNPNEPWPPGSPNATTTFEPWKLRLEVEPRPDMELEFFNPISDTPRIVFLSGRGKPVNPRSPYDGVYIDRHVAIDKLCDAETVETTAWLVVVDKKSLLFSVAKIDLTLKR